MKRIMTILCALILAMAGSAAALAVDTAEAGQSASYYPISVEEYTHGDLDELRINKTYQLSLADDPSLIPTEDFVRNGRRYYLLDMTRKDEVGVDIQTHTETVTQASDTSSRYATGYTVSASYTGEVSKPNCAVVTYTAIFGSEKVPEESKAPDGSENHDPGQTEAPDTAEDLDAAKEPAEQSGLKRPVMIGVVVLALGVGGVFAFKKFKERR